LFFRPVDEQYYDVVVISKNIMNALRKKLETTGLKIEQCVVDFMVLNTTFNNISVILWWSVLVLLVEETGGPGENHRPAAIGAYHH
jgi:hypothetical protein